MRNGRRGKGWLDACALEGIEGVEVDAQAGLHVAGATTMHPTVDQSGFIRLERPQIERAGGHDIDMAVEDEAFARGLPRAMGAHDVDGVVVVDGDRREAWMILDRLDVDGPAVHGKAAGAHGFKHEILGRVFLAVLGGMAHQVLGEGDLVVEAFIDGGQNVIGKFAVEYDVDPSWVVATASPCDRIFTGMP